ncbi:hypothetical protein LO762_29690 [Actinocorallia sp. API 0066]|uniref:hypothetical protein n=1 Tax=Actinocorallia sp. API 0066 TaxID=2896846 RepID=UPI001E492A58|nr:hypothetical protein [Actinocorallia sp. API 0066]MCD0453323.1 hypothetical protein [Actinocorallia sp. API 0066]
MQRLERGSVGGNARERERAAVAMCLAALQESGVAQSKAEVGRRLARVGRSEDSVRKVLDHRRGLTPEFVRDLATLAGLSVTEVFGVLGWLPEREIRDNALTDLAHTMNRAVQALNEVPDLSDLADPAPSAPLAATRALLADPEGQERFEARLFQIISGGRYRTATNAVAEFRLRDGVPPLPHADLARLVAAAGFAEPPVPGDEHAAVRWELRARTRAALRRGQEPSWQGGAAHRTWRAAAETWPGHLLVQDSIAGQQRPIDPSPLGVDDLDTLIVVGGRESGAQAGALLAEALGWQFVLVRPDIDLTPGGRVRTPSPRLRMARTDVWIRVAEHIARRESGPWRTVVLLRPGALARDGAGPHPYAAELLERTPAPILYLRPPAEYLTWWATRSAGNHDPGALDARALADRLAAAHQTVEEILRRRGGHADLLLRLPEPARPLEPHRPEVPAEVFDASVRAAWTAAHWLRGRGLELRSPRPGTLARWRDALARDPDARLPTLEL